MIVWANNANVSADIAIVWANNANWCQLNVKGFVAIRYLIPLNPP
ncbi:hypothetical protein FDUTEX481_09131 [Tolypothrix sp. PCC 7601]|nr:hypothetical protein FDUTEX481_09131 [Tolypothrix sp. PCC 7601]